MTEKRYTITLGKNNEFKEIIDHCRQDKNISVIQFLKQVGEQDKAFKKLKQENERLNKRISIYKEDYSETLNDLQRAEKNIEYGIHRVEVLEKENKELKKENEQLKQQIEELEFKLRTIEAYDRTVKEEHSDTIYDFKKKLEKW